MAKVLNKAESWETIHTAFKQINFNAFDYDTVKTSLIDYLKIYFPEDFNDFIESSEFIALIETFAYIAELFAYRTDVNAHENILTVAQRKDSILRWAKTLSYKASRVIPSRGLVKMVSVKTTENVFDSAGNNLAGRDIIWNDPTNSNWKDQFVTVLNKILVQKFGTVSPRERKQVSDVLFELYDMNNTGGKNAVPFSVSVGGKSYPMEIVPTGLDQFGPYETRPENGKKFSLVYANDGLGDSSNTTGFLMLVKQGTLASARTTFDAITPTQTYIIGTNNVNETDIWVNEINPDTNEIIDDESDATRRSGEWVPVPTVNAQNISFNIEPSRRKYEIETLDNSRARLIFGDGEFADIPGGTFEIWYRTSENDCECFTIPQSSVVQQSGSFEYEDANGLPQTLSFTYSLTSSIQNGSQSETLERVRRLAPKVYYTQDRMVNGRDYNSYPLQDPSILKLRSVNRTFAGDSKYIAWHDPREFYDNVKLFGNDLSIYYEDKKPADGGSIDVSPVTPDTLVLNHVQPLLSSAHFFTFITSVGISPRDIRRQFTTTEIQTILSLLSLDPVPTVNILYRPFTNDWTAQAADETLPPQTVAGALLGETNNQTSASVEQHMITIIPTIVAGKIANWEIQFRTTELLANSETTKFWNTNDGTRIIDYTTLQSNLDRIVLLRSNPGSTATSTLGTELEFPVIGLGREDTNSGLTDKRKLKLFPSEVERVEFSNEVLTGRVINTRYDFFTTSSELIPDTFKEQYYLLDNTGLAHDHVVEISEEVLNAAKNDPNTNYTVESEEANGHTHNVTVTYDDINDKINVALVADGEHSPLHPTPRKIPKPFTQTIVFRLSKNSTHGHDVLMTANTANTLVRYHAEDPSTYTGTDGALTDITVTQKGIVLTSETGDSHTHKVFVYYDPNINRFVGRVVSADNHAGLERHDFVQPHNTLETNSFEVVLPKPYNVPVQQLTPDPDDIYAGNELFVFETSFDELGNPDDTRLDFGTDWDVVTVASAKDGILSNKIVVNAAAPGNKYYVVYNNYVYFERDSIDDPWEFADTDTTLNDPIKIAWYKEHYITQPVERKYDRRRGAEDLAFSWLHTTPRLNLVDTTPSNIIDMFIIPTGYYNSLQQYLTDRINVEPQPPSTVNLRGAYKDLLTNKMLSDSVIMHPGKFKLLFGAKALPELQATIKVLRSPNSTISDNQIRTTIVDVVKSFFDINDWEFGETFYFTELASSIHNRLSHDIESVVLVPKFLQNKFGDLFTIEAGEDEILQPDIGVEDVEVVDQFNSVTLRQIA